MIREDYQETLIGEIPSEWRVGKLGNYLDLIRNGITKRQNHDGLGYPVSRIQTISEDDINPEQVGYLKEVGEDDIEKFRLHPGDILFSHINSEPQIGRSVVYEGYPEFLLHGMNLLRLRTSKELDSHYLNFLFNLYRRLGIFIGIASRSVNQSSINQGKMKSLEIIVPPLPEQRAIAKVLNTVQQAIDATERVIAAARELKRSMMKHLFTYGPVPVNQADKVKLKEYEKILIPNHWDLIPFLKAILKCRINVGKVNKRDYLHNGKIPIIDQSQEYIAGYSNNESLVYQGKLPVIIFGDHTRIFKYIDFPFICGADGTKVLLPNQEIVLPKYFYYSLLNLDIPSKGYSRHYKLLKEQLIPVPPMEEQSEIINYLKKLDEKINVEIDRKKSLEALFNSLLHHLMTGKLRVEDNHDN